MPFDRPTLTQLKDQVAADISSNLPGDDGQLRFSNERVIGDACAGLAHGHYGFLDWIALQAVPFTTTDEFLEGWAALKNVTRKTATAAKSPGFLLSGTSGTDIPAGTLLVRGDGYEYTTDADGVIGSNGSVTVAITAVLPPIDPVNNPTGGGAAGNANTGTILTLGTAIPGVQSNGTVTVAITGGADIETDDSLRTRMLQQYQNTPQGGAKSDYETWALAVAGVTRAWCNPNGFGTGTVVVYIMLDDAESAHNGFPQGTNGVAAKETRGVSATGDQLTVANAIFPLQPVTALVSVVAPVANPINFTIAGISSASATTKSAIASAISGVLEQYGDPRDGTIDLSYIESAIAAIAGTTGFVIQSPTGNITGTMGQLPTLGTVTYV